MLSKLPQEIIDLVVQELDFDDVKSLSAVSKAAHSALASTVWKAIHVEVVTRTKVVHGDPYWLDPDATTTPCLWALRHATVAPRYATQLSFWCDQRTKHSWSLCPRPPDENRRPDLDEEFEAWQVSFDRIAQDATAIVESLPAGQLRGFSWDLGVCAPPFLIEALARQNPGLESLRLSTEYECNGRESEVCRSLTMSGFRNLKRICWRNPRWRDPTPLAELLIANAANLEDLELYFVSWAGLVDYLEHLAGSSDGPVDTSYVDSWFSLLLNNHDISDGPSGTSSSTRPPRSPRPVFPALRALSLTSINLEGVLGQDLGYRIDFGALESLSLLSCRYWDDILKLLEQSEVIRLKSLEIKCGDDALGESLVDQFLRSFEGLQNLALSLAGWQEPRFRLWPSISLHRATLRRLVYHKRDSDIRVRADIRESASVLDQHTPQHPAVRATTVLDLECLGLTCDASFLPALLQPFTMKSTLRLLHLRQTGTDKVSLGSQVLNLRPPKAGFEIDADNHVIAITHDVLQDVLEPSFRAAVEWAFGPQGIASLQAIAFGDFAYGHTCQTVHNIFVVRNKSGGRVYRVFDARDEAHKREWAALVRPYGKFLEACPVGSLTGGGRGPNKW